MICFHFTTFAVLETAEDWLWTTKRLLWFAFILLPLPYWKQPEVFVEAVHIGCDLLSFYYLCRTGNSLAKLKPCPCPVVICFHFTTFAVLETAGGGEHRPCAPLWFAFILLPLPYWKQHDVAKGNLTFVVICFHFTTFAVLETAISQRYWTHTGLWFAFILLPLPYWKQRIVGYDWRYCVVICFHFTTFAVLETATPRRWRSASLLWFAFILLPLPYWKQRKPVIQVCGECCDLLSFYYLCRTGNSHVGRELRQVGVVICFHFTTFAVLETAVRGSRFPGLGLWFAFILLPLPYWKQRITLLLQGTRRCDLLSFYYLCRTGNSTDRTAGLPLGVVICFHFTTFAVLETAMAT